MQGDPMMPALVALAGTWLSQGHEEPAVACIQQVAEVDQGIAEAVLHDLAQSGALLKFLPMAAP